MRSDSRLTTVDFWSEHWESVQLPYLIDLRSYAWWAYDWLLRRLLVDCRGAALEVGSGACQWLVYFHREFNLRVFGLDYSERSCRIGRRNLELTGTPGLVACGDLFAPPLREGAFDLVYSDGVIEHFSDFRPALTAMCRMLAPGGLLIATVPNFGGWFGLYRRVFDPDLFRMHRAISGTELRDALDELGLEGIEVGYFGSFRIPYGRLLERGWSG